MWKVISRGLRETFERRVNFLRKDKTGQECNPINDIQNRLIPGIASYKFDTGTTNDLGGECGSCKDEKQNKDRGEKWRNERYVQEPSFFGAIGWSGFIVLGWYFCQPVCRRRHNKAQEFEKWKHQNIKPTKSQIHCPFRFLSRFVFAQPLGILPHKTHKNGESVQVPPATSQNHSTAAASLQISHNPNENQPQRQEYGPITGEEALDKAADNLFKAQNLVMSGIENRLGVACMQLGKHKEALTYFQKAVELDYAPAAFNLGLCYEKGTGTAQDLKLAAKYYELASKWGHATATYNLGVFYAHGLGGIAADCDRAKQLFNAAAKLGQTNAIEALSMVEDPIEDNEGSISNSEAVKEKVEPVLNKVGNINTLYQTLGIIKAKQSTPDKREPLQDVTNIPVINATKALLEILRVKESDAPQEEVDNNKENLESGIMSNCQTVEQRDIMQISLVF